MTIDNEAADGCIHVYLNHEINLTCRVVSGTPQGTMVWKNNKMVVRKSHSSSVTYSFQPSTADDLAEFSCVANNSLIVQRNIKICLNREYKRIINYMCDGEKTSDITYNMLLACTIKF